MKLLLTVKKIKGSLYEGSFEYDGKKFEQVNTLSELKIIAPLTLVHYDPSIKDVLVEVTHASIIKHMKE